MLFSLISKHSVLQLGELSLLTALYTFTFVIPPGMGWVKVTLIRQEGLIAHLDMGGDIN